MPTSEASSVVDIVGSSASPTTSEAFPLPSTSQTSNSFLPSTSQTSYSPLPSTSQTSPSQAQDEIIENAGDSDVLSNSRGTKVAYRAKTGIFCTGKVYGWNFFILIV